MALNQLKLVGKSSGEIYMLRYPQSLLDFCGYDFSAFAKGAVDLCNEALKTGNPDYDRISELRREVQIAHCYIDNNIRTIYDKIVFDCWIDYVCRRDNIGESGLWNRLVRCKTPFDKAIFARLCEFRYNRASNEWLNLIRVQDYAKSKVEFIFSKSVGSVEEAAARRNYFDMMFSVTAREMGCRIEDLGVTKVFSIGRVPPAPFMFPNVSKEIVRHVLTNFDYSDDYSDIGDYSENADQIAMDAFSRMKAGLPKDLAGYNISSGIPDKHNGKIYMPCSLKAAVDLEIDIIIEDGSWLSRCKRCKRFFLRSREHPEEYCSRSMPGEKSCLELYEDEHPRPTMTPELEKRCRAVTDEVYSRVDKTMSVKEYDSWHLYLEAMIVKVKNGEISPGELESFLDYSLEVDISKSRPIMEVAKREAEPSRERVVKPFVPERISRSEISAPAEPKFEEPEPIQPPKEGFFTSPTVQRQKSERPQISHIIRNGESLGDNSHMTKPDPSKFKVFGAPEPPVQNPIDPAASANPINSPSSANSINRANSSRGIREAELPQFAQVANTGNREEPPVRRDLNEREEEPRRFSAYEKLNLLEERIGEENRIRREQATRSGKQGFKPFAEPAEPPRGERPEYEPRLDERSGYDSRRDENSGYEPSRDERPGYDNRRDENSGYEPPRNERPASAENARSEPREETPPKARVIRKNAAAISAYGKMSGASFTTADPMERTAPESDPFKDIGSIFDVLEQSEVGDDSLNGGYSDYENYFEGYAQNPDDRHSQRAPEPEERIYHPRGERVYEPEEERVYSPRGERTYEPGERIYDPRGERASEPEERIYYPRGERVSEPKERIYDPRGERTSEPEERIYDPRGERVSEPEERIYDPRAERASEPEEERNIPDIPDHVTRDNAPSGIWTEERNLFPHDAAESEPSDESTKEKRHKSNKTQRLFDVIMREPDDNPNFRKKK